MKFNITNTTPSQQKSHCLILPVIEQDKLPKCSLEIDKTTGKRISQIITTGDITGKFEQTLLLHYLPNISAERVLLVGCGKDELSDQQFHKLIQKSLTIVKSTKSTDISFYLTEVKVKNRDIAWQINQIIQLSTTALYCFDQLKSKQDKEKTTIKKINLYLSDNKQLDKAKKALKAGQAIANGVETAKTLANLPGNICTPSYLATQAKQLAKKHPKLTTKVIDEKGMKELGMGALLSVSAGSAQPAKLITMQYNGGKKSDQPYVFVGKGITFDTGGISLKPSPDMDEMKFDMCGAASVFGTMSAVIELNLPINVIGVVVSAENMPGSKATKPGDIVTTMSGQTVEILNTDAEGRLVLCDALTYVERFKPKTVVDIATLTGACVIALGHHPSGMFSNNDELASQLVDASKTSTDRIWQLPLWDDYQELLDSNFADMANIGGRAGGTITAACYLSRFTKAYHWAHLDIAGTAWFSGKNKGATGRPVPLLTQFLLDQTA